MTSSRAFGTCGRPRIVAELNDDYVKVAKVRGEFLWHRHDDEDEPFRVVRGRSRIELRDRLRRNGSWA